MAETRTNVGHRLPACCLTGTLGVPGDRLEEQSPAQVSASIRVLAVKRDAVELKVSREKSFLLTTKRQQAAAPVTD